MTMFNTDTSKIQTLADFSKAAYAVQYWENKAINDPSPGAQEAYSSLLENGWQPVDFNLSTYQSEYTSSSTRFTTTNTMENGYYTHANAAAFVARSGDSLVVSFRGTNDSDDKGLGKNPNDLSDKYHPDKDHWEPIDFFSSDTMNKHYGYFSRLFNGLNEYLDDHSEVKNVYVTGHSMGGSMALEYMSKHSNYSLGANLESVVFAAAPFIEDRSFFLGTVWRKDYYDDSRITQIEIAKDPVSESWDVFLDNNRPGQVVRFYGDQTLNTPDYHLPFYYYRDANHAMDYYQAIAHALEEEAWSRILDEVSNYSTTGVYLAGQQQDGDYIVASQDDVLNGSSSNYDFVYGGAGDDRIIATTNALLIGGSGDDTLVFNAASDQYTHTLNDLDEISYLSFSSGSYRFTGIEYLEFSDTTISLGQQDNANQDNSNQIIDGVMEAFSVSLSSLVHTLLSARLQQIAEAGMSSSMQISVVLASNPMISSALPTDSNAILSISSIVSDMQASAAKAGLTVPESPSVTSDSDAQLIGVGDLDFSGHAYIA
ncbi:lipase family protein [Marinomonas gallaica]|uniref:lipase family protein n=1 Tax=Marinomonas gallaica TaxID=1806667 RepID=UPI003CE4CBC1